jgi:DegV family protein with EDD domain
LRIFYKTLQKTDTEICEIRIGGFMCKVNIVTDSTAYIPANLVAEYCIHVVPLQIIFGEEIFLDGVEITSDQFYEKFQHSRVIPKSSQPSPEAFAKVYRELLEQGHDVISIHISSKLSGTYASALVARDMTNPDRVAVIDSTLTCMGMGFAAIAGAKAAHSGAGLTDCKNLVEDCISRSGAMFALNTLEYLRRGGRIGGAAAFLGSALDLKPIIELCDGVVAPLERVRTIHKAITRLVAILKERIDRPGKVQIAAMHARNPSGAASIIQEVNRVFSPSEINAVFPTEVSPIIGANTGPGTLGIAYMYGIQ